GLAHTMWEKLGGATIAGLSLDWMRVLRPAAAVTEMLKTTSRPAATLLRPFARLADAVALRLARRLFQPAAPAAGHGGTNVNDEGLAPVLLALAEDQTLHPDWDPQSLHW